MSENKNLSLQSVCSAMGFGIHAEQILMKTGWGDSVNTFNGIPDFMTLKFQNIYYPRIHSPIDAMPAIRRVAEIAEKSKEAQLLAWHLHRAHYITGNYSSLGTLPFPEKLFGQDAGVFYLMIAVSSVPLIDETTKRLGLPQKYADASPTWLGGTVQLYASAHNGFPGHRIEQMYWPKFTVDGKIIRIGRLEFWARPIPAYVPAIYINKKGELKVFCRDAVALNSEGFIVNENSPDVKFRTTLRILDGKLTGTPISPKGFAFAGKSETIDTSEWTPLLTPWENVLDIHIPGGGGMKIELLKQSMLEAVELFRTHFHQDIKAIVCCSWIFNTEWQTRIPDSNLSAFQREVFLFPTEIGSGLDGLSFIFGRDDGDPLTYQADNSIRKAMLSIIREGGKLRSGGMFLLTKDLEQFGNKK